MVGFELGGVHRRSTARWPTLERAQGPGRNATVHCWGWGVFWFLKV